MPTRIVQLQSLPARTVEGHKGFFGRVLVIGGNEGMIGAPVLAGTSALRMGAGLVQIAVPKSILSTALSITPELIGVALESDLAEAIDSADSIVLGPGLGQSALAKRCVMQILKAKSSVVVDADGLNILALRKSWPVFFKAPGVLTPHPGEMDRLNALLGRGEAPNDDDGRIDAAVHASRTFGKILVLKGHRTVVSDGEKVYVNRTGNSALSKAGTGDVLSGIIGTLLAQLMSPFDAACTGVWLHGWAGELAGGKLGLRCVLAHEVIDALPEAIREYERRFG